ncbi:MAG: peptide deformylase [Gammaproteobacteria bacterium]|nr:peptide deformylase [Gammaproteobacteria bacterium]MDH3856789.1 peptide deformylase [Gammaproteobacteria bacterium]
MALLNILHFPDPRLRTVAKAVTEFDEELRQFVSDLFETMYEAPGIGLAATQVDRHIRLLVMDVSEARNQPRCLINPEILDANGEEEMDEGCLSVPGYYEKVRRAEHIRVRAHDENGALNEFEAEGLEAVCIQHEMDHLEGKLFVDYLSKLKRDRIRSKLVKSLKQQAS